MHLSPRLKRWLLEGDPSVRYWTLKDLLGRTESDPAVRRARAKIGREGWAAQILAQQLPKGQWDTPGTSGRELYRPKYIATNWRLLVLSDLGLTKAERSIDRAVRLYLRTAGGPRGDFGGRGSEVCFTGNAVRFLVRFGYADLPATHRSIEWLLRAQKPDGGWHCFPSKSGTLDGWEPMAAFASIPEEDRTPEIRGAIRRGAEFYLERGLLREGPGEYAPWKRLHYPTHYYYDLLVGLDMLTALGYGEDRRMRPALALLERMRNRDGTWNLDRLHPDSEDPSYSIDGPFYPFGLEPEAKPSRWITLTALRALGRAGR
jgi:hypothetical protein